MSYFLLSFRLALRAQVRRGRFWLALLLALAAGLAFRWGDRKSVV